MGKYRKIIRSISIGIILLTSIIILQAILSFQVSKLEYVNEIKEHMQSQASQLQQIYTKDFTTQAHNMDTVVTKIDDTIDVQLKYVKNYIDENGFNNRTKEYLVELSRKMEDYFWVTNGNGDIVVHPVIRNVELEAGSDINVSESFKYFKMDSLEEEYDYVIDTSFDADIRYRGGYLSIPYYDLHIFSIRSYDVFEDYLLDFDSTEYLNTFNSNNLNDFEQSIIGKNGEVIYTTEFKLNTLDKELLDEMRSLKTGDREYLEYIQKIDNKYEEMLSYVMKSENEYFIVFLNKGNLFEELKSQVLSSFFATYRFFLYALLFSGLVVLYLSSNREVILK